MQNYAFRLRFELPGLTFIGYPGKSLEIELPDRFVTLSSRLDSNIDESTSLVMKAEGFNAEKEASEVGLRTRNALLWSSAKLRVGLDLGKDKPTGGASKYLKELALRDFGMKLLDDVHGLSVYDATIQTKTVSLSGALRLALSSNAFIAAFQEGYALNLHLDSRQTLAFELYAFSHFESSQRAQFLTLMTSIEILGPPGPRSAAAQEHIDNLIQHTKESKLDDDDKQSLSAALSNLKRISIHRAGRQLVEMYVGHKEYMGDSASEFFNKCYNIRGELVHSGMAPENLYGVRSELEAMIADLLIAMASSIALDSGGESH